MSGYRFAQEDPIEGLEPLGLGPSVADQGEVEGERLSIARGRVETGDAFRRSETGGTLRSQMTRTLSFPILPLCPEPEGEPQADVDRCDSDLGFAKNSQEGFRDGDEARSEGASSRESAWTEGVKRKPSDARFGTLSRTTSRKKVPADSEKDLWPGDWRRSKLECFVVEMGGKMFRTSVSRGEILHEARKCLPESVPSPKAVARWLASNELSQEMKDFAHRMRIKANRKGLRNYLRNSLQPRDIRQVDPAFTAKPALWVRHTAIIVSLESIRAIILHNKVFLFDADNDKAELAVRTIQKFIQTSPTTDDGLEAFEFQVLEGILIHVTTGLEREFLEIEPVIRESLPDSPRNLTTQGLNVLRTWKQSLNHYQDKVQKIQHVLAEVLEEDKDMADMYLTEKRKAHYRSRSQLEHDEVEVLLEAYMQVVGDLMNRIRVLDNEIKANEDVARIRLDTLRNRLLSVDLSLSIIGMTFAFGGLVAGLFGMNLQTPMFEEGASPWWFGGIVLFVLGIILCGLVFVVGPLRSWLYSFL